MNITTHGLLSKNPSVALDVWMCEGFRCASQTCHSSRSTAELQWWTGVRTSWIQHFNSNIMGWILSSADPVCSIPHSPFICAQKPGWNPGLAVKFAQTIMSPCSCRCVWTMWVRNGKCILIINEWFNLHRASHCVRCRSVDAVRIFPPHFSQHSLCSGQDLPCSRLLWTLASPQKKLWSRRAVKVLLTPPQT